MKMRRFSVAVIAVLAHVMATAGCSRSLRDGVSIGVTDELSDGIATLVTDLIGSVSPDGE